ncbi:hypothetical protein BU23DRAFT_466909 [Bimuria novae-zelandiae CBS 107.79]|uniref:endo-1,3(4)-beta-glucanase n=1 Tax=Bimuria novae-zelandiae CBS 107.79 TaxID=1447943 RepID=A0A6A5V672_9PLEO|nr:hypothetical protein BU23DRAFT_466909 [Bimuria novae-zelandiae CBS 107.79]
MSSNHAEKQPASSDGEVPKSPELPDRQRRGSRWNPRNWTPFAWIVVGIIAALVVVAAVVSGVLGARANAYPDYYRIDYRLKDTYVGSTFFDDFDYFTGYDPTHGFVHYVDAEGSRAQNLTETTSSVVTDLLSNSSTAILRVDTSDKNATTGRRSVRITSRKTYDAGLFIFDIVHSPYGCGTWPALWLSDPNNWPNHGEIDVVEAVNVGDTGNHMTLHTTDDCKIGKHRRRKQTGTAETYDCHNATNFNSGCGVTGPPASYGEAFNANGGGVYATELRPEGIRIWMFDRASIPADITAQKPDPSTWGTALADFPNLECDIGKHFGNMSIIANIDLCGDWAGQPSIFSSNPMCTGMCTDYVALKPSDFEQAYWEFGGFWVYQQVPIHR